MGYMMKPQKPDDSERRETIFKIVGYLLGAWLIIGFIVSGINMKKSECAEDHCSDKAEKGGRYCAYHRRNREIIAEYDRNHPRKKERSMYGNSYSYGSSSSSSSSKQGSTSGSSSSSKQGSTSSSSSSSKQGSASGSSSSSKSGKSTIYNGTKPNMPDCDDYDSFEEFMDEWEGHMPDGSDAEDYWDNW